MKNQVWLPICILSALPILVLSQDIDIQRIEERRSSSESYFSNQCTIYLSVRNLGENPHQYVKINEIQKAADNKGNNLSDPKSSRSGFESVSNSNVKIDLLSPAREASAIQELTGNLKFFIPAEANGSIVAIPRFLSRPDKNLLPEKASLKVFFMSPEVIRKKAEEVKKMQEEEMAKLSESEREFASGLLGLVEGFSSWGDNYHNVHFMTEGDTQKLVEIEFTDAKGETISTNGKSVSEQQITYFLNTPPDKDWGIRILYETPASVKVVPFSFKDLKLP